MELFPGVDSDVSSGILLFFFFLSGDNEHVLEWLAPRGTAVTLLSMRVKYLI